MNSNVSVEGAVAPFDVEPENGNMEIVPVDEYEQEYVEEVTPGQAALVLVPTAVVGYGVFRLVEAGLKKWVFPRVVDLGKKLEAKGFGQKKSEDKAEETEKKNKKKINPKEVVTTVKIPEEEIEEEEAYEEDTEAEIEIDKEEIADQENEDRYVKATQKIMAADNKKKKKRK